MQEKIESTSYNKAKTNQFFLPQIPSIQQQRQILKCPNHNLATSVCISNECSIPGLMCLDSKCQCRRVHLKCHHILLDRVLESIQRHQKQIPIQVKQTYKTIYDMINQMIQKLSKLRTKFEIEQQYFGLRQQELQFMNLINDQKIDEVNGKVINSLEKTFDVDIQLNKCTKEQIIIDFQNKRKQFDKLCNYIEESYLQTQSKNIKLDIYSQLFKDSKIVKNKQDAKTIETWVKQSFDGKQISSELLFRASQHKFQACKFHEYCDNKNGTIVIVKNEFDKVFGGFTPIAWSSNGQQQYDKTDKSFVFSLDLKEKFIYSTKNHRSILCSSSYGPVFGCGSDIRINNKCNEDSGNIGNVHFTYYLNQKSKNKNKSKGQIHALFTGNPNGYSFKVKQYEIYQIKLKSQEK